MDESEREGALFASMLADAMRRSCRSTPRKVHVSARTAGPNQMRAAADAPVRAERDPADALYASKNLLLPACSRMSLW